MSETKKLQATPQTMFCWACPACQYRNQVWPEGMRRATDDEVRDLLDLEEWEQIPEDMKDVEWQGCYMPDSGTCDFCKANVELLCPAEWETKDAEE